MSEESGGAHVIMKPKSFAEVVGRGDKGRHEAQGGAGGGHS